jgi:hypothetical protein
VARGEREERPEGVHPNYDREKDAVDVDAVMQVRGDSDGVARKGYGDMVMSCRIQTQGLR